MKQYRYSTSIDSTILTTRTVKFIMELTNDLVRHISPTRKNGIKREMLELKILNRDYRHARKTIGKRGNRHNV